MRKPIEQRLKECGFTLYQTVDLGFWNKDGQYNEDIQEIDLNKELGQDG